MMRWLAPRPQLTAPTIEPTCERQKPRKKTMLKNFAIATCLAFLLQGCGDSDALKKSLPMESALVKLKSGDQVSLTTTHGIDLIGIPSGSFQMGSKYNLAYYTGDEPAHTVRLTKAFFLGKTEVTQAQWRAVMGSNPSYNKGDKLPVENVSWEDCIKFCEELTKREHDSGALPTGWKYTLPTEAQWEYACRAGTNTEYSFGDSKSGLGAHAWYSGNSGDETHSVGGKKANPWGFLDMHGNVYEWCLDWHGDYPSGSVTDPSGPNSAQTRVIRGGSYSASAVPLRSANRFFRTPGSRYSVVGVRLAMISTK